MSNIEIVADETELMIARTLTRELKQNRLNKMRQDLTAYNHAKKHSQSQTSENTIPMIQKKPQNTEEYQEREKAVLEWAKENYQNYKDIQSCATSLNIRVGAIYHILKHHNFIKQNETTEYRVMSAYFKHSGRLADIVEETGLGVWIVAKTIESLGYPPRWHEYRESRYVTKVGTIGVGAEEKFKSLVPEALDMNEEYKENNHDFDFIVNDKTVDVKEMCAISPKGRNYSFFEFKCFAEIHPDFYCLFLCHNKEKRIKGEFDILLIPSIVIPPGKSSIHISTNQDKDSYQYWYQFRVDPNSLSYILGCEI